MKILITYASAGSGHFKAAQAIYNYFRKNSPGDRVKLIDVLDYAPKFFKSSYINGYALLVNYAPCLWAAGFYVTHVKALRPLIKQIHFILNRLNTLRFAGFLVKEKPEFIISTHFLPLGIISYLKKKHKINSRLITVITDFGVHPFWLSEGADIYIVASEFSRRQLIGEGVKEARIKVSGIPIEEKFSGNFDRSALLEKFKLQDKFTVLIVTGSFGIGPIEEIADLLHNQAQVLVVCARNRALFNRLKRKNYPNVSVFGFVDNMEQLMAVSDIIITKPGGLTISEVLAMELVPIFIAAIPGQEATNIEILTRYGIGLSARGTQEIKEAVLDYKGHPDKLNRIKENIRKVKKADILREIYNVVCPGGAGDTG